MKTMVNTLIAGALAVSLTGCIIVDSDGGWSDNDWENDQRDNREFIADLELDTERTYIVRKLGAPSFSEAFTKGDDHFKILYYRTQHRKSDGDTTKDETTPLVFKNDKLIGWGEDTLTRLQS